jgi:hypothetical protein
MVDSQAAAATPTSGEATAVALVVARASIARPLSVERPDNGELHSTDPTAAEWCRTVGRKEGTRDSSPPREIAWPVALISSKAIVPERASDRTVRDRVAPESVCQVLDSGPLAGSVQICPQTDNVQTCPVVGRVLIVLDRVAPVNAGQTRANGQTYRVDRDKVASGRVARVRGALQIAS